MRDTSSDHGGMARADALSEVLQDLRPSGASYCRSEFFSPWGLEFAPEEGAAVLHFVVEGDGWLRTGARAPVRLETGDVALLPRGSGHALVDDPRSPTKRIDEVHRERVGPETYRMRAGGRGARSLIVCCAVAFEEPSVHPLLELMPEILLVRGGASDDPALSELLDAMAAETRAQRIGAATLMARLADIVIVRVVRAWVEAQTHDTSSWLAAIRDPQLGRALAALHRRPGEAWSLESLAAAAHLSRSVFSQRFKKVLGVSPGKYVARWRMHLAGTWLFSDRLTVSQVASRLGYESEASFSRAFKRFTGSPPGAFHRTRDPGKLGFARIPSPADRETIPDTRGSLPAQPKASREGR